MRRPQLVVSAVYRALLPPSPLQALGRVLALESFDLSMRRLLWSAACRSQHRSFSPLPVRLGSGRQIPGARRVAARRKTPTKGVYEHSRQAIDVNSEVVFMDLRNSRFHRGAQDSCTIRNVPVAETCDAPTSRNGLKLDRNRPYIDRHLTFVHMDDVAALRSTGSSHPYTPTSLVKSLANGER
jgi:hypothetical protein